VLIVPSPNDVPVRFTEERWQHIIHRHPEMDSQRNKVLETLAEPDMIQKGDFGTLLAIKFYPETPMSEKFLLVAYREVSTEDGFILTAYLARRPAARREVVWGR
jgi:hypothetical protein